jgi:nitric oxide reductase large subunit
MPLVSARIFAARLSRHLSSRLLIAVAAVGVAVSSNKSTHAVVPGSEVEAQRKALHERVERVRAALTIEAGAVIEPDARSRMVQWYNWGNWPNGWNNYWNNWPNQWWNG